VAHLTSEELGKVVMTAFIDYLDKSERGQAALRALRVHAPELEPNVLAEVLPVSFLGNPIGKVTVPWLALATEGYLADVLARSRAFIAETMTPDGKLR
jgi:hypothetical protein